jgi:hypothetical protein
MDPFEIIRSALNSSSVETIQAVERLRDAEHAYRDAGHP